MQTVAIVHELFLSNKSLNWDHTSISTKQNSYVQKSSYKLQIVVANDDVQPLVNYFIKLSYII